MRLYIAVLDTVPDGIVPTLVAHSVLNAAVKFSDDFYWMSWFNTSFRKVTVKVNQKEFNRISNLEKVHLGFENKTLNKQLCCAVVCPMPTEELPNVLKFAKLWKPNYNE